MAPRVSAIALVLAVIAAGAAAPQAGAMTLPGKPMIVEDLGAGRAVIDGHSSPRPWGRQTLGHLTARWGAPARLIPVGGTAGCIAVWTTPGAIARMANYGGLDACTKRGGLINTIETTSAGRCPASTRSAARRLPWTVRRALA